MNLLRRLRKRNSTDSIEADDIKAHEGYYTREQLVAAYDKGFAAGKRSGYSVGRSMGLKIGKEKGLECGYKKGRKKGLKEGKKEGEKLGRRAGYDIGYPEGYGHEMIDSYNNGLFDGKASIMRGTGEYHNGYLEGQKAGYETVKKEVEKIYAEAGVDMQSDKAAAIGAASGANYYFFGK